MNYFRFFPKVPYTFTSGNTSFVLNVTQISAHAVIMERIRQNVSTIYDYVIEGEERPDNVADRVYGGPQYTWIVLLMNNIISLYDWPLNDQEFEDYIVLKYGTKAAALAENIYRDINGLQVDAITYATLIDENQGNVSNQYEEEIILNDNKRRIKIVPSEFVPALQKELGHLFE